jgi:hypothetical protein
MFSTSQLTGQSPPLQLSVTLSGGHVLPPNRLARLMLRRRTRNPPPQVTEHAVHAPNGVAKQSTGHGVVAHEMMFTRGLQ